MSIINRLIDYLRSSKTELTKVTWPSRDQTIRYSTLVIIISVGVAALAGAVIVYLPDAVELAKAIDPVDAPGMPSTGVAV